MKKHRFVATALLVLAVVPSAAAEDWNPFEEAKKGDWAFYVHEIDGERWGKALRPRTSHVRVLVEDVVKTKVTVSSWDCEQPRALKRTFSRPDGAPEMKHLLDAFVGRGNVKAHWKTLETATEKRKVGDLELECRKVVGRWTPGKGDFEVKVWLSERAPPLGVVAVEVSGTEGPFGTSPGVWTRRERYTLVGYGSGEKATWGEGPPENAFGAGVFTEHRPFGRAQPALEGLSPAGEKTALGAAKGPRLVHFYSTWNECEEEVAFLAAMKKAFDGIEIVGVASVPKEKLAEWARYLEKRGASWTNVADVDRSVAKAWGVARREVGEHSIYFACYLVAEGKVAMGDAGCAAELFGSERLATVYDLKKLYPAAKVPRELDWLDDMK